MEVDTIRKNPSANAKDSTRSTRKGIDAQLNEMIQPRSHDEGRAHTHTFCRAPATIAIDESHLPHHTTISVSPRAHCSLPHSHSHSHSTSHYPPPPRRPATAHPHTSRATTHSPPYYSRAGFSRRGGGCQARRLSWRGLDSRPCSPGATRGGGGLRPARSSVPAGRAPHRRRA